MKRADDEAAVYEVNITGPLGRRAAEVLQLEIRHLAKRYGVEIKELRIEDVKDESSA